MADPLDRIRQLIALATDPGTSEAEARTVAFLACRAIKTGGVRLTLGPEQEMPPGVTMVVDIFEVLRQAMEDAERPRTRAKKKGYVRVLQACPRCGQNRLFVRDKSRLNALVECGGCEYTSPVREKTLRCACGARQPDPGRRDGKCKNCGHWADRTTGG